MTADATNSPRGGMDCARVAREEIPASYLLGRLSEADRDAFEQHYFECERCFEELQTLQAVRTELKPTRGVLESQQASALVRWSRFAGLAAAVVLVVGALFWMRAPSRLRPRERPSNPSPSGAQVGENPKAERAQPFVAPAPSFEQLARVEPPVYEPRRLRGPSDEATERFQRGMQQYVKADYAGAARDLRAAADLDPDAPHISFFLGISCLMAGQDTAAIDRLGATIALGDSPYLEEAHFYLAKAFLRRKNPSAAETHLKSVVQLHGPRSAEAGRLIAQIERLKQRSD